MEIAWPGGARQRWVARVGDRGSSPLPLEEAKKAAMLHERGRGEPRDWIAELNQIAANEVDRAVVAREKRKWPVDLMGGQRHRRKQPLMAPKLRQAILDAEIGFIAAEGASRNCCSVMPVR
jgi:hypothetical protein